MEEFIFYRKKFEKSQRAKAQNQEDKTKEPEGIGALNLNKEMFDPQTMQQ
jgi:hypothetical protein